VFNSDGSMTYTPGPYFRGYDKFTYRAFDGTDYGNVATVHIGTGGGYGVPTSATPQYNVCPTTANNNGPIAPDQLART
jgi:hypothetical protein